jgi:hypothetical protein
MNILILGNWQRSSITKLDIADGIVACKFNKPCEVEIIKLVLRSTISQLHSDFTFTIFCLSLTVEGGDPNKFLRL